MFAFFQASSKIKRARFRVRSEFRNTRVRAPHGKDGQGGRNAALSGPERTVANYVPHATTIFDYTRRAMPWQQPKTLTNDEVYAVTAYILVLNKIIGENDVMDADKLPKVKMPNRDGFVSKYPERK